MEQRISIITLGVKDLEKSRSFYDSLGWKVATEKDTDNIIAYNLNGMALVLYPVELLADDIGIKTPRNSTPTFTIAHNVSSKEDVSKTLEEAEKAGGKIIKPAQDTFWGGHSGYFCDPDGYYWEVAFNPFSQLGEKGEFEW